MTRQNSKTDITEDRSNNLTPDGCSHCRLAILTMAIAAPVAELFIIKDSGIQKPNLDI